MKILLLALGSAAAVAGLTFATPAGAADWHARLLKALHGHAARSEATE